MTTFSLNFDSYPSGGSKCYHSHPALPLLEGKVIYGGNCGSPVITDADIYVGLDRGTMRHSDASYPWTPGVEFLYPIMDMSVPTNVDSFKALIDYLIGAVNLGQKVHVGCIGGHGRTGMVLAAMVAKMGVSKDAIGYVREHYCDKAVETSTQITFLMEHFGVVKATPTKGAMKGAIVEVPQKKRSGPKPIVVEGQQLLGMVPPFLTPMSKL